MPRQFIQKKPLTSIVLVTVVCFMLGLVVTQVQASMQSSIELSVNNQHLIPNDFNPKLHWEEQKIFASETSQEDLMGLSNESFDKSSENIDTIHSVAMKNNKSVSQPVYDFTTGTSN